MNEVPSTLDWKEIGITAAITVATAFVGCLAAVLLAHKVILPAMEESGKKKDDKEQPKK